jgi:hypothetical protein
MWKLNKDKTQKIHFVARDKHSYDVCPRPFPASQAIPKWWKDASPYIKRPDNPEGKKIIIADRESNASFKKCTPMLDMISSGYIIPLWADVQVRNINGLPNISWRVQRDVFEVHYKQEVEVPDGYGDFQFKFLNEWIPVLPKGYSALIMPCPGYPDSAFKVIPAVIDYDKTRHPLTPPMLLKNGFEGIVEKGTPMFQVIPFKRTDWKSEFSFLEEGEYSVIVDRELKSTIVNNYVKNFWQKKTYK